MSVVGFLQANSAQHATTLMARKESCLSRYAFVGATVLWLSMCKVEMALINISSSN